MTGDRSDVRRVCRQVMNKTVSKRIISKQEATVLLADLDLFTCTETIESVSISNAKRITVDKDASSDTKTFIKQYAARPSSYEQMSLHDYFHHVKNRNGTTSKLIIPNFVGVSGTPVYPVTSAYARHTLIVHRPWREYPSDLDWIGEFNCFINSENCPLGPKITYERVVARYIEKMTHYEPTAAKIDHSQNPIDDDDMELLYLTGQKCHTEFDAEDVLFQQMDKGMNFQWDTAAKVRTPSNFQWYHHIDPDLIPLFFGSHAIMPMSKLIQNVG